MAKEFFFCCLAIWGGIPYFLGMYPVFGPGRALSLAMMELGRAQPVALSQRTSEVKRLKGLMASIKKGEFILLTGEAGSGGCVPPQQSLLHGALLLLQPHTQW